MYRLLRREGGRERVLGAHVERVVGDLGGLELLIWAIFTVWDSFFSTKHIKSPRIRSSVESAPENPTRLVRDSTGFSYASGTEL